MFIYLIVNHITGKYYVGQHKGGNLKQYLQKKFYEAERKLGGRRHLYKTMRKHGREAFTIHALLSNIQTKAELDQFERDFITFLKSQDPEYGYNLCRGGEGVTGPHAEESRKKISLNNVHQWSGDRGCKEHGEISVKNLRPGWNKGLKTGKLPNSQRLKVQIAQRLRWATKNPVQRRKD